MKKKILIALGAATLFAAGFAAIALALGSTSGAGSSGGPTDPFVYDGQTIAAADFGPPWTTNGADGKGGWISTPLDLSCQAGTLAIGSKVEYGGDVKTETFTPPQGDIIVGVLWKSGHEATVQESVWTNDGSSVSVTLSKGWSGSRIFYCVPTESTTETTGSTTGSTTTVTTPGTTETTTVTTPGTTGTTTVTTPGTTTGTTTVTTPGSTGTTTGSTTTTTVSSPPPPPPKKHHSKPPAPKKKLAYTP